MERFTLVERLKEKRELEDSRCREKPSEGLLDTGGKGVQLAGKLRRIKGCPVGTVVGEFSWRTD